MSERTTAEIVVDLRSESAWLANVHPRVANLVIEAADRLSRPRFTAEQVEAVALAIHHAWCGSAGCDDDDPVDEDLAAARAALSAIGEVDG